MAWFHFSQWLPCVLCGTVRAKQHHVCHFCWQNLPWDGKVQTRQDIEFIASCYYAYPISRVIHQFKDQAQFHYLPLLSACLLQLPKPQVQAIVPMPLSTEKLIQRGYSQTYVLAQALSKHWQIPIWQPIAREQGTSQRGLDRLQRLANLEQQFYIAKSPQKSYRKVLMLDDVITTGASFLALQNQLKQLGCTDVHAMCLCNAPSS